MNAGLRALVHVVVRRRRSVQLGVVVVALVVAAIIPQLGSSFYVSLTLSVLIYGLLAISLDVLAGYTGLISLGHASFLGVGAYGIAYALKIGLDPIPAIGYALVAVLVTALLFGLVAVRVRELTFVILTLALGQIVWGLAYRWVSVSGGDNGLPVPGRPSFGPFDFSADSSYYYLVLVVFVLCVLVMWLVVHSSFGLSLRGIRDNEARMRTLGYNVVVHKYLAFIISAMFGGVAGVLFAFYNLYVSPTMIDFAHNGTVVQMVVVGGLGTLWGPLVGAGVIVFFQQFVSIYVPRWETVLGVIFILTVLFARGGLWGGLANLGRWLRVRAGEPPTSGASTSQALTEVDAASGSGD
ncbi:MAG TPA: branched-chain amino acid ABC transporter permease [Candidatus Nitrosotalea sp.]|nr:branched-chain amino acid ABC transporter permease [Candidatus Nitrosotalea sp.]